MGVRHALFPVPALGALQAAGFPTLFSTASGVFGLVAGPASVSRLLAFEWGFSACSSWWLRHRLANQTKTRLRLSSASWPFRTRSAAAFDGAFAWCTGLASSLSGCLSFAVRRCRFWHRRPSGRFSRVLPRPRVLPGAQAHFVPPFGVFRLADLFQAARVLRPCWCTVATGYPLGNCDSLKSETNLNYLTRLGTASHRSWPPGSCSRYWQRATAVRGTGESCLRCPTSRSGFRGAEPTSLAPPFPSHLGLSL